MGITIPTPKKPPNQITRQPRKHKPPHNIILTSETAFQTTIHKASNIMNQPNNLEQNRQHVLKRIQQAQRPNQSVTLITVSKTFPSEDIRTLYQYGQHHFGENYIQEWQQKYQQLSDCKEIIWHIIGNIQSNKSRPVAEHAHWVHTIDRIKLAQRLNDQRPNNLPALNVLIEINISNETNKHGIHPDNMLELAQQIVKLPKLKLRGLMCVASANAKPHILQQQFQSMQQLLKQLQQISPTADTLSMGMSHDLETAIQSGANMVRIGSAIFGNRHKPT